MLESPSPIHSRRKSLIRSTASSEYAGACHCSWDRSLTRSAYGSEAAGRSADYQGGLYVLMQRLDVGGGAGAWCGGLGRDAGAVVGCVARRVGLGGGGWGGGVVR